MKTRKHLFGFLFLWSLGFSISAQQASHSIALKLGKNLSDLGYGIETLSSILPKDAYIGYGISSIHAGGDFLGLEASWDLGNRFDIITSVDIIKYGLRVKAEAREDLRDVPKFSRPDVPVLIGGKIDYDYLSFGTGFRYFFKDKKEETWFMEFNLSYQLHLNTIWELDVIYEDRRQVENVNYSYLNKSIDYKDLWFVGLQFGRQFYLSENFRIAPAIGLQVGLNPVVDPAQEEVLHPMAVNFELQSKWNF